MTVVKTKSPPAIRISATPQVRAALRQAKKLYPAMSDAEIFKLGLSNIVLARGENNTGSRQEEKEIMGLAANSVGEDYLSDPKEDIYTLDMGKRVNFS